MMPSFDQTPRENKSTFKQGDKIRKLMKEADDEYKLESGLHKDEDGVIGDELSIEALLGKMHKQTQSEMQQAKINEEKAQNDYLRKYIQEPERIPGQATSF